MLYVINHQMLQETEAKGSESPEVVSQQSSAKSAHQTSIVSPEAETAQEMKRLLDGVLPSTESTEAARNLPETPTKCYSSLVGDPSRKKGSQKQGQVVGEQRGLGEKEGVLQYADGKSMVRHHMGLL